MAKLHLFPQATKISECGNRDSEKIIAILSLSGGLWLLFQQFCVTLTIDLEIALIIAKDSKQILANEST
ncbi:MAG: hypothetical protein LIP02_06565 [Bacteroidales bacterium]|nr:hypothetical protein [Bacteroidales bacterium]